MLPQKDQDRFWSHVDAPLLTNGERDPDQAWLWQGAMTADGHGRFWLNGRHELAHRVSFFLANGWVPEVVCHVEPVPGDVNPHRLYAGSPAENVADRQRQERQARGEHNGRARLSEASVRWARNAIAHGTSLSETARRLGIHKTTLHAAVTGKTWQHLAESSNAPAGQEDGPRAEGEIHAFEGKGGHSDPPNASSRL